MPIPGITEKKLPMIGHEGSTWRVGVTDCPPLGIESLFSDKVALLLSSLAWLNGHFAAVSFVPGAAEVLVEKQDGFEEQAFRNTFLLSSRPNKLIFVLAALACARMKDRWAVGQILDVALSMMVLRIKVC